MWDLALGWAVHPVPAVLKLAVVARRAPGKHRACEDPGETRTGLPCVAGNLLYGTRKNQDANGAQQLWR